MPCRDDRDDRSLYIQDKLDYVTRAACAMARVLEQYNIEIPREAAKWWAQHKQFDRREGRY